MNRNIYKKETYEDKFARKYYCNSYRFVRSMKRRNRKIFRRFGNREVKKEVEDYINERKGN